MFCSLPKLQKVLHPYLRLQLDIIPLLHCIHLQVLAPTQIQRKLKGCQNRSRLPLQLIPLRLRRRKSGSYSIWNYPDEFCFKRPPSFDLNSINVVGRKNSEIENASCHVLLSCGSIIPIKYASSQIIVKIMLEKKSSEHKYGGIANNDIEFLLDEQDLSELILNSNEIMSTRSDTMYLPDQHIMNILPNTCLPGRSVLQGIETCYTYFFEEGKDIILLQGDEGSGKTYFTLTLAAKLRMMNHVSTFYLDCRQLQSSIARMDQLLLEATSFARLSSAMKPLLLILDNIDQLIPISEGNTDDRQDKLVDSPALSNQVKSISDHVLFLLKGLQEGSQQYCKIILTCRNHMRSVFNEKVSHLKVATMKVPPLTGAERVNLLSHFLSIERNDRAFVQTLDVEELVFTSEGYSPHDIKSIAFDVKNMIQKDSSKNLNLTKSGKNKNLGTHDIVTEAFVNHVPSCYKSIEILRTEPELRWSDIGGLLNAKLSLCETILQPIRYKKIYSNLPVSVPKGILLFGPPGCGCVIHICNCCY